MDTGIVHNDDQVGAGELVHVVKETINKTIELLTCIWVVFNGEVEDTIEREGGKNRVTVSW